MRNPVQITRSGAGVQASAVPLSKTASIAQLVGIADTTVALDVDVYLVMSVTQPTTTTGGTWIGKIRAAANTIGVLPLVGGSGGVQVSSPNVWVVVSFNDTGTTHILAYYQDQE